MWMKSLWHSKLPQRKIFNRCMIRNCKEQLCKMKQSLVCKRIKPTWQESEMDSHLNNCCRLAWGTFAFVHFQPTPCYQPARYFRVGQGLLLRMQMQMVLRKLMQKLIRRRRVPASRKLNNDIATCVCAWPTGCSMTGPGSVPWCHPSSTTCRENARARMGLLWKCLVLIKICINCK